jgi:hypothetical protein
VQEHGFIDILPGCGVAATRMARERAMMAFINIIVIAVSQTGRGG